MAFESVTRTAFDELLAKSGSKLFRQQLARYDLTPFENGDCAVHRGHLSAPDFLQVPAFNTIIVGDLSVDGLVDIGGPDSYEEGGLFIVLGHVACSSFAGGYRRCTFIDGNLEADSLVLNAFDDSSLVVTRNLRTHFFYGRDIWAEVGGTAEMHYGDGYCLPIGYTEAADQAIEPMHDRETSLRRLVFVNADFIEAERFLARLRSGRSVFRRTL
jgi:hypothetical protein